MYLCGAQQADSGTVQISKAAKLAYLEQMPQAAALFLPQSTMVTDLSPL